MTYRINVGDTIPHFMSNDQDGARVTDSDLIGGPIVLYFYPKDGTPGCTKEACSFRDNMEDLEGLEVLVIGVSPDTLHSHQQFIETNNLNYILLSDEKLELCKKFDVVRMQDEKDPSSYKIERTTFLIDPQGVIQWIERPVQVDGHVERVKEAINKLPI